MFLIKTFSFKDDFQYFIIGQKSVFWMSGPLGPARSSVFFAQNVPFVIVFHKKYVRAGRSRANCVFYSKNPQKYRFLVEITLKNFHLDPKTCQNSFLDLIYP